MARTNGYHGPMIDMPLSFAKQVYKSEYWDKMLLDQVSNISSNVAIEMFDTGVNTGISEATQILQRSLNVLNLESKIYSDIAVDGMMGQGTLSALQSFVNYRKTDRVLYKMMNCLQGAFYVDLAEKRIKDEEFIYGWMDKRVSLESN